jgi:hypothetical protein
MTQSKDAKPPEPPKRRNWPGAIASDAGASAATAFARAGFSDPTLVLRWHEIAGPETARLARPVKLTEGPGGGVLTLRAEPGAALFLQHETRALTERVNAYLGRPAVAKLRFVQGPLLARPTAKKRAIPPPPGPSDPANRFKGPQAVRDALLALARARNRPRSGE